MTDKLDLLIHLRPEVTGPSADATARATRNFARFLAQHDAAAHENRSNRTRRRSFIVVAVVLLLVAFGGVAAAIFADVQSDGVIFTSPAVEAPVGDSLTVAVQESNLGTCLEVRSAGGAAGGCGLPIDLPLGFGVGGAGESSWVSGWGPLDTAEIDITFVDGTTIVVTEFQAFDGYEVTFFAVGLDQGLESEPGLVEVATAYDASGKIVATFDLDDVSAPVDDHHEP